MIRKSLFNKKHAYMLAVLGGAFTTSTFSHAGELNFSGFMSIGGGWITDVDSFDYNGFYEDDVQFNRNILGIQLTGEVSDKLSATAQLTTRSSDDYDINAEWAYMTYALTDESQLRIGRLRTPFYLYSDYLDVGYSYSWVSPPREVYYLPINNIDGIDYFATGTVGSFDASVQAYFGGFNGTYDYVGTTPENPEVLSAKTRNQLGVALTLGQSWWNMRAAFHQANFTLDTDPVAGLQTAFDGFSLLGLNAEDYREAIEIEDDATTFLEFGFTIDTERFIAAAEHIEFETEDAFLPTASRSYLMLGVRFGDVLLHGTMASTQDDRKALEDLIAPDPTSAQAIQGRGIPQSVSQTLLFEQDVMSLGVRWDFTAGAAFKVQVDQIDRTIPAATGDKQTAVTFALQSVF